MKFITALPIAALPNERVRRARLHGELHLQRPPSERTSTGHWLASLWRPYRCTPTDIFPNIDIPVLSHSPALQARGLSPLDVVYAVNAQNLILSGGTAKIGSLEYNITLNGSTATVQALNDLPVSTSGGRVIYLPDVAHVRGGYAPQTNIVRTNGTRSALLQRAPTNQRHSSWSSARPRNTA